MTLWRSCAREDDVRKATISGRWTPALEGHLAACGRCEEVHTVTRALASPMQHTPTVIDPRVLFARARATAQVRAMARVEWVLTLSQVGLAALAVAGLVVVAPILGIATDGGGSDLPMLAISGGVMLTITAALAARWAKS
jgi:hypothetical protein